jgi:hypothetical protein
MSKETRKIEHRDVKGHMKDVARRTHERFAQGAGDNRDEPTELIPDAELPFKWKGSVADFQPSTGAASSSSGPDPPARWPQHSEEWLAGKGGHWTAWDDPDQAKRPRWTADFGDGKPYWTADEWQDPDWKSGWQSKQ